MLQQVRIFSRSWLKAVWWPSSLYLSLLWLSLLWSSLQCTIGATWMVLLHMGLYIYLEQPVFYKPVFYKLVKSVVVAVFIIVVFVMVVFVMVVFVIAHCRNNHNIAPHGATAAEALIFSLAVVQEGSPKE